MVASFSNLSQNDLGSCDILRLTVFVSSAEENDPDLTMPAAIDPVASPDVNPQFNYTFTNGFGIS